MSPTSARRTPAVLWCAVVVLLVAAGTLSSCSSGTTAKPKATPTPIARLNTSGMRLPRIDFCSLVPSSAVTDALGGRADDHTTWGDGDKAPITTGVTDVVQELGCSWTTDAGDRAQAWLFARPVDQQDAARVVSSGQEPHCTTARAPEFGSPTLTLLCTGSAPLVRHAGLFGQTWLTCEVTGATGASVADVRQRADDWCVQVVNALDTDS